MKKSKFIDYNVILATLSHRKKKHLSGAGQQKSQVMEFSFSISNAKTDNPRKIAAYSKELIA